jgi:hypothetical protein
MNAYELAKSGSLRRPSAAPQEPASTWQPPQKPAYGGTTFDAAKDGARLNEQCRKVYGFMADGCWHTPAEIETATGANWASASARLRDLRKPAFGGFRVERERAGDARGLFRYRLLPPLPAAPDLFTASSLGVDT